MTQGNNEGGFCPQRNYIFGNPFIEEKVRRTRQKLGFIAYLRLYQSRTLGIVGASSRYINLAKKMTRLN